MTDSNASDGIDVTTSGAVLTLDGGTQINSTDSGALKIGTTGAVDVTGAATLDGVVVTDRRRDVTKQCWLVRGHAGHADGGKRWRGRRRHA